MSINNEPGLWPKTLIGIAAMCGLTSFAATVLADDQPKTTLPDSDIIIPAEDVVYETPVTLEVKDPPGVEATTISFASFWRDTESGASAFLAKLTKGSDGNHTHPDDYEAVVLKGVMAHWTAGLERSETKRLGAGSYWYQPANILHREDCLSEECILFVSHKGRVMAAAAQKP